MSSLSDIDKIIRQALSTAAVKDAIGKSATRQIKTRTRTGKGVEKNLEKSQKLPGLKPKTKTRRRQLKRAGGLTGRGATPAKSNLTRSGKLVDSVQYERTADGVEIKLDRSQEEKAQALIQINRGYTFMKLSKAEFNRVVKAVQGTVNGILNRINFNKL